ncbi:MAG: DUF881 domain-containing protein [Chloroflexota bacterium]
MLRTNRGVIWASIIALFLGFAAVTQVHSQEVYSRSLNLETPSSLTTLIANLSETNNELRNEIFDLRKDLLEARDSVANGKGTLTEAQRQLVRLRVFSAQSAVSGPGISIKIEGSFDERALSDLVNELRNAGAEAISVNEMRVGPKTYFTGTTDRSIAVDGRPLRGPWTVRAIGAPDVVYVAMTRTGGIIGQFELIYRNTRFVVAKETALDLPAQIVAAR